MPLASAVAPESVALSWTCPPALMVVAESVVAIVGLALTGTHSENSDVLPLPSMAVAVTT